MRRLVDLSHPIRHGQAAYPGDPPARIQPHSTVAEDGFSVTQIHFGSHHATHLDAPSHFFAGGRSVEQIALDRFFGPAALIDLAPGGELHSGASITPAHLQPHQSLFSAGARVIYRTGWSRRFGGPDYYQDYPILTAEAAEWIAARRIGLLGMDTPSPDGAECHQVLLRPGVEIVIVEGLANLDGLPPRFVFIGFPLTLEGVDGSPIRAIALIE
ncbi:MAG TPA: cyclase family protein [Armatimonadota bacterium]|nr:cyclase family protein [Armatimonadota bacterium]